MALNRKGIATYLPELAGVQKHGSSIGVVHGVVGEGSMALGRGDEGRRYRYNLAVVCSVYLLR